MRLVLPPSAQTSHMVNLVGHVKKVFVDLGYVVYYFFLFGLACCILAVVEIINLAGLLRRKETK